MPAYDASEVHEIRVDAPPAVVYRELLALTPREIRIFRPLMALRMLPSRLRRRSRGIDWALPLFDEILEHGFVRLAERPSEEIVFGAIGRFWKVAGNPPVRLRDAADFEAFAEPGFAKAVMSFRVETDGEGSRVITETRVAATDEAARRSFRRYWRLIRPGSGLIRRSWLKALRRRAEGR